MKKRSPESTLLVLSTCFLIMYIALNLKWSIYLSLTLGIIGIISETLSSEIEKWWFKLSNLLGTIMPKLILTVVFYLFLTPIALLYRLFNNNKIKIINTSDSYFADYRESFSKENMEKIW